MDADDDEDDNDGHVSSSRIDTSFALSYTPRVAGCPSAQSTIHDGTATWCWPWHPALPLLTSFRGLSLLPSIGALCPCSMSAIVLSYDFLNVGRNERKSENSCTISTL